MGAWIEIVSVVLKVRLSMVAPHMGAWIEINFNDVMPGPKTSRTPHGCVD